MVLSPVFDGALKEIIALPLPEVAVPMVGVPGTTKDGTTESTVSAEAVIPLSSVTVKRTESLPVASGVSVASALVVSPLNVVSKPPPSTIDH